VKFVCNRCHTSFTIRDGELSGRDLRDMKCVLCEGPMQLEPVPVQQDDAPTPLQLRTGKSRKMLIALAEQALAERVCQTLRGLDWRIVRAETAAAALNHLENTPYDLVFLHDRDVPPNRCHEPVLRYLQQLPMILRRAVLVCLLCEQKPTLDFKAALCAGVNLVVNVQDVERLPGILSDMMEQHETSYEIFEDELRRRRTSL